MGLGVVGLGYSQPDPKDDGLEPGGQCLEDIVVSGKLGVDGIHVPDGLNVCPGLQDGLGVGFEG